VFSTAPLIIFAALVDTRCAKLFALCDRGIDLGDCIALAPTSDELQDVLTWLQLHDANPDWPDNVRDTIADVAKGFVMAFRRRSALRYTHLQMR
jgi:hypothetical protein